MSGHFLPSSFLLKSLRMSTVEYRSYLPTSKAMAFLFKILIHMRLLSIEAIRIYAFYVPYVLLGKDVVCSVSL